MYKLFTRLAKGYERYMIRTGRERARLVLLGCNDRLLEDNGFSRELLEQGLEAWPWKALDSDQQQLPAIDFEQLKLASAMAELNSYSDKELNALELSRSAIPEAVKFGRDGIERNTSTSRAA